LWEWGEKVLIMVAWSTGQWLCEGDTVEELILEYGA